MEILRNNYSAKYNTWFVSGITENNLAVFFAYHVLWPTGLEGAFEWPSALLAIAAAVALLKYKRNVMQVIAVSALAGLLLQTFVL